SPISRLCCYLRAEPPAYQDLRWVLTSNCEEPHASLCIMQPCEEQTVRCEDGSRCINKAWKCDGHWDCKDGSDEAKCNEVIATSSLKPNSPGLKLKPFAAGRIFGIKLKDYCLIFLGLVRHLNQSFIWSNGQTAVEQDGFWAVNGLDSINASPISRLCCYLRAEPPAYQDLRWVLTSNCEEPHVSLCIMQPCEEQTLWCEDGSRCINKAWKCDGHWDCRDGSDEAKCNEGSSVTPPSYSRQCGSLLKGASGVLVSPNFPSHYPAFSSCTWKIEVLPPSVIEITVETLAIEAQYDSLQIFDCPDTSDTTLLDHLDGNVSNTKVISSNNCVLVKFQSDHSIEASGFNITWQAVDSHVSGCGGTLYATRSYQHLRFPTSRSRVFKQTSCEWLVSASASTVLHIL
uniref:CUB domain-containing protein n=1 Tax=Biomphalaria glabrata TaxID=6526 RepID=A0A2C9M2F1_BIOGL